MWIFGNETQMKGVFDPTEALKNRPFDDQTVRLIWAHAIAGCMHLCHNCVSPKEQPCPPPHYDLIRH